MGASKMCGIAGLYTPGSTPESKVLSQMNKCQRHRGPDDSGVFLEGSVGLAHRRLSIIDLNSGHQPITNEDDSVVVIFNGEIYNYVRLRSNLQAVGHNFSTETDTEVLVHLYEEHGIDFVAMLDGMFAFALWDREEEHLIVARDKMGIKPLYIINIDGTVGFASELPALFYSGLDLGHLDIDALSQYFALGYIPAPKSAFSNVQKLMPGRCIIVTPNEVSDYQYHVPTYSQRSLSIEEAATELRSHLENAVKKRLMSDVPLGAFLSGGIDSSVIVGIMSQQMEEPVNTFTVGFDNDRFDESWAASRVADHHATNHRNINMSVDDVRELIPEVLGHLGEPFADQSLIPSFAVARETRRDVKVALSGDGADELFAGYDKYRAESLSKYYRVLC